MGQRDDAAVVTMATAAAFHEAIGPRAVEVRVRALATAIKERLVEAVPGIRFHTPRPAEMSGGVVVFALPRGGHREVFQSVYESHRLGCAAMGGVFDGVRLSPHVYNTMSEVDTAVEAIAAHA
jgi:selenocysteine lyase/cysteine desulfurase